MLELTAQPPDVLLATGFESLIRLLKEGPDELAFSVFVFDGILRETTRTPFEQIASRVSSGQHGLQLTWEELLRLAEDTFDVWNLLLAGFPRGRQPAVRQTFEELARAHDLAVEIFDSSSLRLALKSEILAQRVVTAFPALRPVGR